MAWYNFLTKNSATKTEEPVNIAEPTQGYFAGMDQTVFNPIYTNFYDGEKTPGELGAILDSNPEYLKLRLRAYDANLKIDLVRIITSKFFKEIIGSGLKLQAEPIESILKLNGLNTDLTQFKKGIESYFNLYASINFSDYSENQNFHDCANDCLSDSFLGGDNLFILRVNDKGPNIQIIDGQQVQQPNETDPVVKEKIEDNVIVNGVEIDKKGNHVAFYVIQRNKDESDFDVKFARVKAKDSSGRIVAKMVYGDKHRVNDVRGVSKLAPIIEKINKMDRYTEATVGKMEESANVVLSVEHSKDSTGEDVFKPGIAKIDPSKAKNPVDVYEQGQRTAANIQQTTSKKAINMPIGSSLKGFESGSSASEYESFSKTVFMFICASVPIPMEVALQMYNSNYSASRAAINSWDHLKEIIRKKFARNFYDPFYKMYLEYMILTEKVKADGYLEAMESGDFMVVEAYSNARWVGPKTAHIDPLKEVKAVELMLALNLISREQAVEILNQGNWEDNYNKFKEEGKIIDTDTVVE